MKYMLILANDPDEWTEVGPHDDDVITDWSLYTKALQDAGVLIDGSALRDSDSATTVRRRNGELLLTDGPFVDIKEHLIGYYVIEVSDLDAALRWASRVPNIRTGTVEVRPLIPELTAEETLRSLAEIPS